MSIQTKHHSIDTEEFSDANRLRSRAIRGGAVMLGSRFAVQGFTWIVTLLVARYLRPLDYGILTAGGIFISLGDILAEAGIGRALVQKREITTRDASAAFTMSLILALLVYSLLFLIAGPAAAYFSNPDVTLYIRVAGLVILTSPFRAVSTALLDRRLMLERQSALQVSLAVAQSCVVLALAASGYGYWALAIGTLSSRIVETFGLAFLAGWRPRLAWISSDSVSLLRFGLHLSGATLLWFLYSNADYAVVGRVAGATELGYYSLAFMLISLPVQKITVIVNQIAYPVYCRLNHEPGRASDWWQRLLILETSIGLPIIVGMALVAPDALGVLLGTHWTPAAVPLRFLAVVGALQFFSASLMPLCNAIGRPDVNLKYTFVCVLLFPPAFYLGGHLNGLIGVCAAWTILHPIAVGGLFVLTRHITGLDLASLARAQQPILFALLAMTGAVLVTQQVYSGTAPNPIRLILCIVVGAFTYFAVFYATDRKGIINDLLRIWSELRGRTTNSSPSSP